MGRNKNYNKAKKKDWFNKNYTAKKRLYVLLYKLKVIDPDQFRRISYDHYSW